MMTLDVVLRTVGRLDRVELEHWIEERWVIPERGDAGYFFREVDVARVHLITELRHDLAIDEEAMPVVLNLLDQVYSLRRRLKVFAAAVDALPPEVREAVLAKVTGEEE